MKETPKIPGVPEGELLGDLPHKPEPHTGEQRGPRPRRPFTGFIRTRLQLGIIRREKRPRSDCPFSDGSVFVGDKGIITTGTYGEQTRLIPVEKMRDYKFPEPLPHPVTRPLPRLDPRLQRWRRSMFKLQRRRSVRRVDASGCDCDPR